MDSTARSSLSLVLCTGRYYATRQEELDELERPRGESTSPRRCKRGYARNMSLDVGSLGHFVVFLDKCPKCSQWNGLRHLIIKVATILGRYV